jgi:dTDP-4-amino-4,6-dideoxygalactose transaminase
VEQLITPQTTGIIAVHLWGRPCDIEVLEEIASRRNLRLLFDAAHAFGCAYKGKMIGNYGDAEVFSFHATKFLNSLEGGAIVTNDPDLARKARAMKDFGFDKTDKIESIGINGKMNEISAAMGLTSLESLDRFVTINYRNYKQYQRELTGIPGVTLFNYNESEACNYQYIVLEFDEAETAISRDQMVDIMTAENVLVRRYFYPGCHRIKPYFSQDPHAGLKLAETEGLLRRVIVLPTGTAVSTAEIDKFCQIIRMVVAHGKEVRERLERN